MDADDIAEETLNFFKMMRQLESVKVKSVLLLSAVLLILLKPEEGCDFDCCTPWISFYCFL